MNKVFHTQSAVEVTHNSWSKITYYNIMSQS